MMKIFRCVIGVILVYSTPVFATDYTSESDCDASYFLDDVSVTDECNSNTGTNSGATRETSGCHRGASCYSFAGDGTNDNISIGDVVDFTGDFLVSWWHNLDTIDTNSGDFNGFISKRDDFAGMAWAILYYNSFNSCDGGTGKEGMTFGFGNSNANQVCSQLSVSTGVWEHWCIFREGTTFEFHKDGGDWLGGSSYTETDSGSIPSNADEIRFGLLGNGVAEDEEMDGKMDDVLIMSGGDYAQHVCENIYLHELPGTTQVNPLDVYSEMRNVLHTDTIYFPSGKDGYKFWLVHTPFPCEDCTNEYDDEHPWMARSNDMTSFTESGITNPIVDTTAGDTEYDADPDMLYIEEIDKWFLTWGAVDITGGDDNFIGLAYSSDGKSWTTYDGVTINGNTNPAILKGTDSGGAAWERSGSDSRVLYPALIYEGGTFTLYYGDTVSGNNNGEMGCATFTWNNSTDDVENFARCSGNPILSPGSGSGFDAGIGHMNVTYQDVGSTRTYTMTGLREVSVSNLYEIWTYTSSDPHSGWGSGSNTIDIGSSGEWNDYQLYRGGYVHTGKGEAMVLSGQRQYVYSAYRDSSGEAGDGATGVGIDDLSNWGTEDNTNYLKSIF